MGENNKINIIYDNRNSDDYGRLLGEFMAQSVIPKYKFWDCVIINEGMDSVVRSINASHKMIVRWAKENNMPYVIIAEQDLMFTCDTAWEYFLSKMPKSFDIYLACSYIPNNDIICGFHLYILHGRFYDKFLDIPDNQHIDTAANDLGGEFVFCKPFPALQRIGYSANNKVVVDYNKVLKDEDTYKG